MYRKSQLSTALLVASSAALLAVVFSSNRPVESSQIVQPPPAKWEYITSEVEEASLQGKLGELALDGWEVFAVTNSEMVLEQTPDDRPNLVVTKFTLTAKRPQK